MRKPFHFIALFLVLTLLVGGQALPAAAQGQDFTLTVLHTNDVHARVLQFDSSGSDCDAEENSAGKCFGGAARRETLINSIRAESGATLLVDAGDQFQGTLFYNQYKGEEAAKMMNDLGYQAMTPGNHEFDNGPANLARFLQEIRFPMVSANIDASQEPALAGLLKPHVILEINGQKIGVTGVSPVDTPEISSPGSLLKFNDPVTSASARVKELQQAGVNKIILLSHLGYQADQELAAAVDGIDVIVGGHTHTYLANGVPDPSGDLPLGPYPTVVSSPGGAPVLVVTDYTMGKYLGRLDVTFDADGKPTSWKGEPIPLDAGVAQDPAVLAEAETLDQPLKALRDTETGSASKDLVGDKNICRFAECSMGNLITDAILWKTAPVGIQVALINGGGIRASIPAGSVTLGEVLTVLPYGNTIATFELKGSDLLAALEHGVSKAENPTNEGTGRFLQVSGLRFSWNPKQPEGKRIIKAEVRSENGTYLPLDPQKTYKVAANDYLRRGGDGYEMFASGAVNPYDFGPTLSDVVAEYIQTHSPVSPRLENRISRSDLLGALLGGDVVRWAILGIVLLTFLVISLWIYRRSRAV